MRVQLSDQAENAIRDLALQERRDARRQVEWMIEAELERRGLIRNSRTEPVRLSPMPSKATGLAR